MPSKSIAEFKLSITKALADQLAETLEALTPSPLSLEALSRVESRPGVYILFVDDEMVYVGKTAKSLPERLQQHLTKISGRSGISLARVKFVCVYVDKDMDSVAPEKMLISKLSEKDELTQKRGIPWNNNGFGNKDPGQKRDKSLVKANHFDATYPIDLNTAVHLEVGETTVAHALAELKRALPFNLRYDTTAQGGKIAREHEVTIPAEPMPARAIIPMIVEALPDGWQATALPGYVILYPQVERYESATGWWHKSSQGVAWHPGPHRLDTIGRIDTETGD